MEIILESSLYYVLTSLYYVSRKPNTDDDKIYLSIAIRAYAASLDATDHRVAEFAVPGMKVEEEVAESLVGFGIVNAILQKLDAIIFPI